MTITGTPIEPGFVGDWLAGEAAKRPGESLVITPTKAGQLLLAHEAAKLHAAAAPVPKYRRKPFPGCLDWCNWAAGLDNSGLWHLFHFRRSGRDHSTCCWWNHHDHVHVNIRAGRMHDLAVQLGTAKGSFATPTKADIDRIKPLMSRLRKAIIDAVSSEGYCPKGKPIEQPTSAYAGYRAIFRFGKASNDSRNRHWRFSEG